MITEVMTRTGKHIHVLSESDLDVDASGKRLRAFCPIHGSDHQRSLSIDADSGWGFCHCCHATVLVEDYAPDIAATLRHGGRRSRSARHPPDSATWCHITALQPHPPTPRPTWQSEEVAALSTAWSLMREELASARASAYLDERGISPDLAESCSLGYLSYAAWEDTPLSAEQQDLLCRWRGRMVFPLGSPDGRGYIGRTLSRWEPGMDECEHKAVLEAEDIPRWLKTNPAGWYGPHPSRYAPTLILVEGGFDRLSLIAAGVPNHAVVALVGTTARVEWIRRFAPQVQRVVLALDGDEAGRAAMASLAGECREADLLVECCPPPQDGSGKDWNERWRRCSESGIVPLWEVVTQCQW